MPRGTLWLSALVGLLGWVSGAVQAQTNSPVAKQLIEFGWDEPDTALLRAHIDTMQRSPFGGCVFHVNYPKPNGGHGSFTWEAWGQRQFTAAELQPAFTDLRTLDFGRFNRCFLRFNTTPAKLDWFDSYRAILANARLAAELARVGHCPGLLFDIEQYEGPLFNYRKQRDAKTKSWAVYAAQARRRGREVMTAFQEGYPGLTVFLTFGYSLPWVESHEGKRPLADCSYGLLTPFLDGLVEAAHGDTRLVDGYELSYGYKTAAQFAVARETVKHDLLPIVSDPAKYQRCFTLGFGLWLDRNWRKRGWHPEDVSKNYFTPETWATSVREALRASDHYVWIYSETPRWWTASGATAKLPAAYVQALRAAKAAASEPEKRNSPSAH